MGISSDAGSANVAYGDLNPHTKSPSLRGSTVYTHKALKGLVRSTPHTGPHHTRFHTAPRSTPHTGPHHTQVHTAQMSTPHTVPHHKQVHSTDGAVSQPIRLNPQPSTEDPVSLVRCRGRVVIACPPVASPPSLPPAPRCP
eukprot:365413-Chlamydomonas_euryale.AAC.1